jgi:hypothetical protein
VNIRIALSCAALGTLIAGAAHAQYSEHHRYRCDRPGATHDGYICDRDGYWRRYDSRDSYAYRYYDRSYPDRTYYPDYDDSDFYGPYGQLPRTSYYEPPSDQGYYEPPPTAEDYGATAAYESGPDVAPVYVPARRFWWEHPGDTSPAAQYSVRLHGYVNPHSSVTAIPTPNNVSDQIPSHGPDYDGVPPDYPY